MLQKSEKAQTSYIQTANCWLEPVLFFQKYIVALVIMLQRYKRLEQAIYPILKLLAENCIVLSEVSQTSYIQTSNCWPETVLFFQKFIVARLPCFKGLKGSNKLYPNLKLAPNCAQLTETYGDAVVAPARRAAST